MGETIRPHGGTLINRIVEGEQRDRLLEHAKDLFPLRINAWTISDLDLIGVGAFSPLTGFMGKQDYHSVVERMRLADGTVWSLPITLGVEDEVAKDLEQARRPRLLERRMASFTALSEWRASIR